MPADWTTRLAEQEELLARSVSGYYDDGVQAEALRIATSLRVLVHETAASTPLLALAVPDYRRLTIVDCARRAGYTDEEVKSGLMVLMTLTMGMRPGRGVVPLVALDGAPLVDLETWWRGYALVYGTIVFARKDLVLVLANKAGGAHVDPDGLPPDHERLITDGPLTASRPLGVSEHYDAAHWFVAQSGAEMLELLRRLRTGASTAGTSV